MYTISDISKMFNLPASTIRYYEKIGLIENVEHKNGYHRIYDDSHVNRLHAIECFKKALLPLEDIKLFFEYEKDITSNSLSIVNMMKNHEQQTLNAIRDLEAGLEHLQKKIRFYTGVNEAIQTGGPMPDWNTI